MDTIQQKSKNSFKCKYCSRTFRKESTMVVHKCEPKRRMEQRNEKPVKVAFMAYQKLFQTMGYDSNKKYEDFAKSSYYTAFVKFGWHMHNLNVFDQSAFIDFVLDQNIKLDKWCEDWVYEKFLIGYIRAERSTPALERSILCMDEWGKEKKENFINYFTHANKNRIVQDIKKGKMSPWVIYNCNTGIQCLEDMNDEQLTMIEQFINLSIWIKKFSTHSGDTEWIKNILKHHQI